MLVYAALAKAAKAGSGTGSGTGGSITVDSALSPTSENPVQNKVIFELALQFNELVAGQEATILHEAEQLINERLGAIENGAY